jgi:hypothetical protein
MGSIKSVSVIVDEFDIFCTSISPDEADAPLRVHADTVLPATVAGQLLKPIPWWNAEILDIFRRMDQLELPQRQPLHQSVNALDVLLIPDALGVLASERSDHDTII